MLLGLICPREIFTNSGKIGEDDDLLTGWLTADGKKPISRTSKLTKKFTFIFGASNAFWLTCHLPKISVELVKANMKSTSFARL